MMEEAGRVEAILGDIRDMSGLGSRDGKPSVVDSLIDGGWVRGEDLVGAFEMLEARPATESAAAFCQLDFAVRLPSSSSKWFPVNKAVPGGALVRLVPHLPHPEDKGGGSAKPERSRTQVTIVTQLHGRAEGLFENYLQGLARISGKAGRVVVGSSKRTGRLLTVAEFEQQALHQLRDVTLRALREILPLYATVCLDPDALKPVRRLNHFLVMLRGGRILRPVVSTPAFAGVPARDEELDLARNLKLLDRALRGRRRDPSVYERFLAETARLVRYGEHPLAVVQCVMILEWFANEIITDRLVVPFRDGKLNGQQRLLDLARRWEAQESTEKPRAIGVKEKFQDFLGELGIGIAGDATMWKAFCSLVSQRNHIIHRGPGAVKIDAQTAEAAVRTASDTIRHCMGTLLRESEKRATQKGGSAA